MKQNFGDMFKAFGVWVIIAASVLAIAVAIL